jgi:PAS domain S-box-containing protein
VGRGGAPDAALDRSARIAARLLRAPAALLVVAGVDRGIVAAVEGADPRWQALAGTPAARAVAEHAAGERGPFTAEAGLAHPWLADETDGLVTALAGVPVVGRDGVVVGSLCVADAVRREWDDADLAALADLADGVAAELARRVEERAATAQGAELRGLLDDTTELVCATGEDGRISYVNRAWERAFGYTADEARRLRPVDMVAPEDRGRYLAAGRRLVGGEPVREYEAVLLTKGGRRMVCRGWATPLIASTPEGRRCVGTRAGYRDVTAERHAEAVRTRLAATLEASPDLVALATTQGRIVFLNRAGRALVGLGDDADLSALLLADLWPENDQLTMMNEAIPSALEAGAWEGEVELVAAGGERIPVSQVLVAHPSTRPGEPPYFVSAVMRDLRDRERTEAAIRERAAEARVAQVARASEARLRALEERLRLAVAAGGVGTYDWDLAAGTFTWDERCRRALGVAAGPDVALAASVDETLAALLARVHPDDRDRVRDLVARAMDPAGDGRVHSEHRVLGADGAPRWTEVRGQVHLAGPARTPSRFVGTVLDVTERKAAEIALAEAHATLERRVAERTADLVAAADALRVSEARFRAASEGSLDALLFLRAVRGPDGAITDFAIVDCNARAAALVRMPHEDLVGHHLCELFPEHRASGAFDRYVQVVASGETIEAEFGTRDPRYTAQWLRVQASALGDGLALSTRDISERKRLETALAAERAFLIAVLDNLRDGVVACDAEGRLTLFNHASREIHGLPEQPLPPERWAEHYSLFRPDGATPLPTAEIPLFRAFSGEVVDNAEIVVAADGAPPRTLLNSGRAFYDEGGAKLGAVVAMHDVTTRREAERFKDQLIGTVSHELRTPLTAIKGALDLLAVGAHDERESRLLHMASRNTSRLVRMVNDLLDVERISSGAAPLSLEALPVDAILSTACEALRAMLDGAGLTLVLERSGGAAGSGRRVSVWADADRLTQVVTNLVSNAVKFTPRGGTITVGATPAPAPAGEAEGAAARVHVRDTGRGIAADKLERIFNRFEQVDAADAKEKGGAGLGLAICRAIVRQHGGRIWAESAGAGAGSAFYFTLPTAEAELTRQRP